MLSIITEFVKTFLFCLFWQKTEKSISLSSLVYPLPWQRQINWLAKMWYKFSQNGQISNWNIYDQRNDMLLMIIIFKYMVHFGLKQIIWKTSDVIRLLWSGWGFQYIEKCVVWADLMSSLEFTRICTHICALCNTKLLLGNKFIKRHVWECILSEALP